MDRDVQPSELKHIGSMPGYLARPIATAPDKNIHSELHAFVDETRKIWGETAKIGPGSFGYYLKWCDGFSVDQLRRIRDRMRDAQNVRSFGKLFISKLKELKIKK